MERILSTPVARAMALMATMVLMGGIIGFGWEQALYTPAEAPALEPLGSFVEAPEPFRPLVRSAGDEAVLRRVLPHFPTYPRASLPEVLAADYLGPKAPIAVVWFTTGDTPDQVMEHYRQALETQGLPAIGQRHNANAGYVGYWNPGSEELFLVSTIAQGNETLVFLSAAQPAALGEAPMSVPEWVPLPPRLEERMVLSVPLEGAAQHTASGLIPIHSLREGTDSYRALLEAQGWRVEAEHDREVNNEVELEIRRGQVHGTALLKHTPPASRVHLFLSLRERL
jgi:hypothetical protein